MRQLSISLQFLIACIKISITLLDFVCGQIDTETCQHKEDHCAKLIQTAFQTYPNYRDKRTMDLIEMFGYPAENHEVITEDGYILTVQRIPYSPKSGPSSDKIPVFCMHGGSGSSAQWFWQPAQRALIFMLADAGYDVWLGNSRGNTYSQKHLTLPVDDGSDLRYWNHSLHDFGKYDDPAVINYITDLTSQQSIYWICHSVGCAQLYIASFLRPEINSKIRTVFSMAPAAFSGNVTNVGLKSVAHFLSKYRIAKFFNKLGQGTLTPEITVRLLVPILDLCKINLFNCGLCGNMMFLIMGYSCQLDFTTLPGLLAHFPDVMSVQTASQYMQWVQTGIFGQYDYGRKLNKKMYGKSTPPAYDISKVDFPVVIYHSASDNIAVPADVAKTVAALGSNVKEINLVNYANFRHFDFITGTDADTLIYKKIIETMDSRKYERAKIKHAFVEPVSPNSNLECLN